MKNKFIVLCTLLCLTGCFPADRVDKAQQDYVCHERGGVSSYVRYAGQVSIKVQCMDGSYQNWLRTVIPKEHIKVKELSYE